MRMLEWEDLFEHWDAAPVEDAEETVDYSDLDLAPAIPTIDALPEHVDYSTRAPGDFVISGPLGAGRGQGRHFNSTLAAQNWAVAKYGRNRVKRIDGESSEFRWAFLIKAAG